MDLPADHADGVATIADKVVPAQASLRTSELFSLSPNLQQQKSSEFVFLLLSIIMIIGSVINSCFS